MNDESTYARRQDLRSGKIEFPPQRRDKTRASERRTIFVGAKIRFPNPAVNLSVGLSRRLYTRRLPTWHGMLFRGKATATWELRLRDVTISRPLLRRGARSRDHGEEIRLAGGKQGIQDANLTRKRIRDGVSCFLVL